MNNPDIDKLEKITNYPGNQENLIGQCNRVDLISIDL